MPKSEAVSLHGYWQRRATEAILIKKSRETMNLYNGLQLPTMQMPSPIHCKPLKWRTSVTSLLLLLFSIIFTSFYVFTVLFYYS